MEIFVRPFHCVFTYVLHLYDGELFPIYEYRRLLLLIRRLGVLGAFVNLLDTFLQRMTAHARSHPS
jgi:hypothetical protein